MLTELINSGTWGGIENVSDVELMFPMMVGEKVIFSTVSFCFKVYCRIFKGKFLLVTFLNFY